LVVGLKSVTVRIAIVIPLRGVVVGVVVVVVGGIGFVVMFNKVGIVMELVVIRMVVRIVIRVMIRRGVQMVIGVIEICIMWPCNIL